MDNYTSPSGTSYPNNYYNTYSMYNSNVYLVTGLQEAIMRTTERGSDMVYFDQVKTVFYRVKMDMQGVKTWNTFTYNVGSVDDLVVPKQSLDDVIQRLDAIEKKLSMEATNVVQ